MKLVDFNELMKPELLDPAFAEEYVKALLEESIDAKDAGILVTGVRRILDAHREKMDEMRQALTMCHSLLKDADFTPEPGEDKAYQQDLALRALAAFRMTENALGLQRQTDDPNAESSQSLPD